MFRAGLTTDCVVAAGAAWLRDTEALKNRKGADYKIQKSFCTHPKIIRQLSPLTLVMQIAALQQKVCNSLIFASSILKSCSALCRVAQVHAMLAKIEGGVIHS